MIDSHDNIGRINWVTSVKNLLYQYGFGYVWISQDIGDLDMFLKYFKMRLNDCKTQDWSASVNESSRCDTYKHFKSLLEPEKYLSIGLSYQFKKALSRLRCSNYKFTIETGRHQNIPREERICTFCFNESNTRIIDNEYHAFFHCEKYAQQRNSYLYNWYHGNDGEFL